LIENRRKKCLRTKDGITLIALVITIIVLLILAGVTVAMVVGENGIISKAVESKEKTKEAGIIENITQAYASAQIDTLGEKVTVEDMQKALDGVFGENVAEAIDNSDTLVVKIEEKYYEIDNEGNVGEGKTIEPIEYAGDITKTRSRNRS
jgi:type II secretory pathway pseudopilin PulG